MPAPTFLCIGPPKCGTTWIAGAVTQHPDVLSGVEKELDFFAGPRFERGLDWYEAQFTTGRPDAPAVGEFSPGYLTTIPMLGGDPQSLSYGVAERVAAAYPDLRLIVCLRDPVDRTVSAYYHNVRYGICAPSDSVEQAAAKRHGIIENSYYGLHLSRWMEFYDSSSFLVLCYEEDIRAPEGRASAVARIFEHIGVDASFEPERLHTRRNSRSPHFQMRLRHAPRFVQPFLRRLPEAMRAWPLWDFEIASEERAALASRFQPDVERLEALLGRSFPWPQTKHPAPA